MIIFFLLLFGANPLTLILGLGLNGWMIYARLARSEVRGLRGRPFVEAAVVSGVKSPVILRRHIIPHLRNRAFAVYLLDVPRIILAGGTLSFLGLGIQPPDVSWGL